MKLCRAIIKRKPRRSVGDLRDIFNFDRSSKPHLHVNLYGPEFHLMSVMSAVDDESGTCSIEMLISTCRIRSHRYTNTNSHIISDSMLTIKMLCADF